MQFPFRRLILAAFLLLLSVAPARAQTPLNAPHLPDLSIELGQTNRARGLSVPDEGDGQNVPATIGGIEVRRMMGSEANVAYLISKSKMPGRTPGLAIYSSPSKPTTVKTLSSMPPKPRLKRSQFKRSQFKRAAKARIASSRIVAAEIWCPAQISTARTLV